MKWDKTFNFPQDVNSTPFTIFTIIDVTVLLHNVLYIILHSVRSMNIHSSRKIIKVRFNLDVKLLLSCFDDIPYSD